MGHECTEAYRMGTCPACGEAFWVCPGCDRYGEVRYCGDECKLKSCPKMSDREVAERKKGKET